MYCTVSAFDFYLNYNIHAVLCADRIFNFSQICSTDNVFWDTDVPVIICFTWQMQSVMTHEVQTWRTCDSASLLSFCPHLILYSFILRGPRCFLLVGLLYFHIWEKQQPLLALLSSFLSTYLFTWLCEDFIKQTGSNDKQHGSLLPKRKSWVAVCYPESFEVIGVAVPAPFR